jgi:gliding motility-associated-like protein
MMKWDDPKYSGNNDQGMATDSIYISWVVCVTPSAATNIFASANGDTDIDLEWTNGTGSGRYVVINTVNSFSNPVDGVSPPAFNPVYSGSGEQVVYAGPANSVTVSGLLPCTDYYFRVFEYNCSGVNTKYCTPAAANNPAVVPTSNVNLPADYTVSGQTAYCSNDPAVVINLSGSESGVNYQLLLDGTAVGSPLAGTGSALVFNYSPLTAGTYTVQAIDGLYASCSAIMPGSVVVTISPSPSDPATATADRTHICSNDGGNITLTSTGGSGTTFEWYSGACGTGTLVGSTQSLTIPAPTTTTTYFGRWITPTCGNSACLSVTITVDAAPSASVAGPNQGICGSLTATLAATAPTSGTGLWTTQSGPGTITYANPAANNTGITASVIGVYTLVWTVSNGAVCTPSTSTVEINFSNALTVTASCNTPICSGDDIYLYSDIAGATYSWNGPNGFTSNQQNPVITGSTMAAAGIYTLDVTGIPGGCPNTSDTTSIVIYESPSAPSSLSSNPTGVCAGSGGNLILTYTGGVGDTLHWYEGSCGGTHLGVGNNLSVPAPASTTTYYAQWASNTCGVSACASVTVNVEIPPSTADAGSDQSLCGVTNTTLAATVPSPGTGTWSMVSGPGTINFANPANPFSAISASVMGIYTLRWTVSNGTICAASTDDVNIEFSNAISVSVNSNSPVCEGDTIFLTSSIAGSTYAWTGPGGYSSNQQNPFIPNVTAGQAGTYTINVSGIPGGCPPTSNNTSVTVVAKPNTAAITATNASGGNQQVCIGSAQSYSISPPTPGSNYQWSLTGPVGTITTATNLSQISIDWTTAGGPAVVSVIETSASGCEGNPVILNVNVNALPTILTMDTTGATNGQNNGTLNATASGSGPFEYSVDGGPWSTSGTFNTLLPGNHTLQVRDVNGCTNTGNFTINNIFVGMTFNGGTAAACPGNTVMVPVYATGFSNIRSFDLCLSYDNSIAGFLQTSSIHTSLSGTTTDASVPGNLHLTWDGTTNVTINNGDLLFNLEFSGIQSGIANVDWNDFLPGICGVFDQNGLPLVTIFNAGKATFYQTPQAIISGDTELCVGEALDLTAEGDTLTHNWTLPDGSTFNGHLYQLTPVELINSGKYLLEATNTLGCTTRDSVQLLVHPLPTVSLAPSDSVCAESENILTPGNAFTTYLWPDNSTNASFTAYGEGIYWVRVTDANGCAAYDTVSLIICPAAIYVPTAFSPNLDGHNDYFKARYSDVDVLEGFSMYIYNRWGQLLFETNDINFGWDGKFNGVQCPTGMYTYVIKFKKPTGKTLNQESPVRGLVTLVR